MFTFVLSLNVFKADTFVTIAQYHLKVSVV